MSQATLNDRQMALNDSATSFMESLGDCGLSEREFENVAATLGILGEEVKTWMEREHEPNAPSREELDFQYAWLAAQCAVALNNRVEVSNPAILQGTEQQLKEWSAWYASEGRRIYEEMENILKKTKEGDVNAQPGYAVRRVKFDRQAELYWQCARRLGWI